MTALETRESLNRGVGFEVVGPWFFLSHSTVSEGRQKSNLLWFTVARRKKTPSSSVTEEKFLPLFQAGRPRCYP